MFSSYHMHRQTNGARLVHDGALDVLPHPPGGVGGKTETAFGIEFLQRVDQSEVALLDQVVERNTPMLVVLGDADDEAQVGLDHVLACDEVAGTGSARQHQFLGRGQQRRGADLVEIELVTSSKICPAAVVAFGEIDASKLLGRSSSLTCPYGQAGT
jgi:hypothetical protein